MKCQVCHADVGPDAAYCPHCGAKLAAGTPLDEPSAGPVTANAAAVIGRRRAIWDVPEQTLWEGSYSPKAMIGPAALTGAVSLVLLAVAAIWGGADAVLCFVLIALAWLVFGYYLAAKRLGIHYRLTNQMFYHRRGVLTRVTNRVEAIDIDDVTYEQGPLERLMNVGKIKISSSDKTDPDLWVEGVENVQEVAHLIDQARRAERIRRGVSVEAV